MPSLRKTAGDNYLTYWYFNLEGWYVPCILLSFKEKSKLNTKIYRYSVLVSYIRRIL